MQLSQNTPQETKTLLTLSVKRSAKHHLGSSEVEMFSAKGV